MNLTYVDSCGGTGLTILGGLVFVFGTAVGTLPLYFALAWLTRNR